MAAADTGNGSSMRQARSIALLSLAWGASVGSLFITVSSGTASAAAIKSDRMATLPIGVLATCSTLAALTAQLLTVRLSRRVVLAGSAALGVLGALLCCIALRTHSFLLMVLAAAPQGIAFGTSNLYRFIAAELVQPEYRERALAAVVGGAVLAAFIGPEASRHVRFKMETDYLAAFILAGGLYVLQTLCVLFVDYSLSDQLLDKPAAAKNVDAGEAVRASQCQAAVATAEQVAEAPGGSAAPGGLAGAVALPMDLKKSGQLASDCSTPRGDGSARSEKPMLPGSAHVKSHAGLPDGSGAEISSDVDADSTAARPWPDVIFQHEFMLAAVVSILSYYVMTGLMAASPLSMADAGHTVDDSTLVIVVYIVSRFLPSLFSGSLVRRLAPENTVLLGTLLLLAGVAVLFTSMARWVFYLCMVLMGVGWNFNYVSASALVVKLLRPKERVLGQGVFDLISLTGLSVGMLTASFTCEGLGWVGMYQVYMGFGGLLLVASVLLLLCRLHRQQQAEAEASAVAERRGADAAHKPAAHAAADNAATDARAQSPASAQLDV